MGFFLIDEKRNIQKSYEELILDLNQRKSLKVNICEESPYGIFRDIILSMACGIHVTLLDSEMNPQEMPKDENADDVAQICLPHIKDYEHLIHLIQGRKKDWRLSMFSTGTTGKPKRITHTYDTMVRQIRMTPHANAHIWGFAYNPTHFAGLQVLLQAFFNHNPMIYIFDADRRNIAGLIDKYSITHISATPTYYRTLLAEMTEPRFTVHQLTVGGEKFDPLMAERLKLIFPNAAITNIYASTEAGSLFKSRGEYFEINDDMVQNVRISKDGELLLHKALLAGNDELAKTMVDDEWYPTGDLVESVDDKKIRFISRKTELINIGGYKVNPHEVEEKLQNIEHVREAVVYGRSNRVTGSILIAKVQIDSKLGMEEMKEQIINTLRIELPKWKVPAEIIFCEEIEKSRTGKKVRA